MPAGDAQIEDIIPLTPMQAGMLFHSLSAPDGGVYVLQAVMSVEGRVDADRLQRACGEIVRRHAALRASFHWQEVDAVIQVVHRSVTIALLRHDWRETPDRRARLQAFLAADRARGFAVQEAPLLRLHLIRLTDTASYVVWSCHHILVDGWSLFRLLPELWACYEADAAPTPAPAAGALGPAGVRPHAHAAWLASADRERAEAFWRRTLAGFTTATPVPFAASGAAAVAPAPSSERATRERDLSPALSARVQQFARQERVTPGTLLHGVWALLLGRCCGRDDVLFGTITSGRPAELPGADAAVGMMVNTLPLRARIEPEIAVGAWLRRLQAQLVELREHEASSLVDIQKWSDLPRGVPLFATGLAFQNYPLRKTLAAPSAMPGALKVRMIDVLEAAHFPLGLIAGGTSSLWLRAQYDPALFGEEAIDRLLACCETLLQQLVEDGARPLGEIALLAPADRTRVLTDWNAAVRELPELCVHELVERAAARTPDSVAVCGGTGLLTFASLNQRANRLAHHLRRLGVEPETRVAVLLDRSPEAIVALLAILKAGGAYVPIDRDYPPDRIAFMLADAGARAIVSTSRLATRLPACDAAIARLCLDTDATAIAGEPASNPSARAHPDGLAYIVFTSGSTGVPKGVGVPHRAIVRLVCEDLYVPLTAADRVAQAAPLSFDAATFEIWSALSAGASCAIVPEAVVRSPRDLFAALDRDRVTAMFVTTALFNQMVAEAPDGFRRMTHLLFGGEAANPDVVQQLLRAGPPARLLNVYGPTETTTFATSHVVDRSVPATREPVPIGRPLANTPVLVVDDVGQLVPAGVAGELWIGGEALARGYVRRAALTAERFVPHPCSDASGARMYRTGDIVRRRVDGELEFVGRRDHQVKIRGHRVEPGEVEAALVAHPDLRAAIVTVQTLDGGEKRLVAYIVPTGTPASQTVQTAQTSQAANAAVGAVGPAVEAPTMAALRAYLHERVPAYMVPALFVTLAALPLNVNGKVDRAALPEPGGARPLLDAAFVAPRTEAERSLAAIWAAVLQVSQVGATDNFFELGGDSILAIQIVARARAAGLALLPRHLFEHQTVEALARAGGEATAVSAEQGLIAGVVPLTPIQHWFFAQQLADPQHFNQAQWFSAAAPVDLPRLEAALAALVAHHDALRLRFRCVNGEWCQEHAADDAAAMVPVTRLSMAGLPRAERVALQAATAAALQTQLDLAHGPLMRVALCDAGPSTPALLCIVVHHLAIDIVSWSVLAADLSTACAQLAAGRRVELPPKTSAFQTWARRLQAYAASAAMAREAAYWSEIERTPVRDIPIDHDSGPNSVASARTVTVALGGVETTALLQAVPRAYHTRINDVLLTALAQAIQAWTGGSRVRVAVEGHGRVPLFDDLDLSRTVGWFTTIHPVLLDLSGADAPGAALKQLKEQLRGVPHDGLGYGLWRYLTARGADTDDDADADGGAGAGVDSHVVAPRGAPVGAAGASITFNYKGQIDTLIETLSSARQDAPRESPPVAASAPAAVGADATATATAGWLSPVDGPLGGDRSPRQTRVALIEVDAVVRDGRFRATWTYSHHRHAPATVARVAEEFLDALRTLIAHCTSPEAGGFTPSDFGTASLSQAELDALLAP